MRAGRYHHGRNTIPINDTNVTSTNAICNCWSDTSTLTSANAMAVTSVTYTVANAVASAVTHTVANPVANAVAYWGMQLWQRLSLLLDRR